MGESKQCLLAILAASRALACLKQEIARQIVHASGKSAYDNVTVFFSPFFVACYVKEKTRLNIWNFQVSYSFWVLVTDGEFQRTLSVRFMPMTSKVLSKL